MAPDMRGACVSKRTARPSDACATRCNRARCYTEVVAARSRYSLFQAMDSSLPCNCLPSGPDLQMQYMCAGAVAQEQAARRRRAPHARPPVVLWQGRPCHPCWTPSCCLALNRRNRMPADRFAQAPGSRVPPPYDCITGERVGRPRGVLDCNEHAALTPPGSRDQPSWGWKPARSWRLPGRFLAKVRAGPPARPSACRGRRPTRTGSSRSRARLQACAR